MEANERRSTLKRSEKLSLAQFQALVVASAYQVKFV
jgi:hypothetical protein